MDVTNNGEHNKRVTPNFRAKSLPKSQEKMELSRPFQTGGNEEMYAN